MSQRVLIILVPLLACQLLLLGPVWLGASLLTVAVWRGRLLGWRWLLLGCVLGLVSAAIEVARTQHPSVPVGAVVVQPTSWQPGSDHYYSFSGRTTNGVYVSGGGTVDEVGARQIDNARTPMTVQWHGDPTRISGPRNLYEFDYRAFAWAQYHQAYRLPSQKLRVMVRPRQSVSDWLFGVRMALLMRMDQLPDKMNTYARALILGLMDGDMNDMRDVFSRLGIIHLFSVSGLHIFALVGMLYWLTDRCRIPHEWVDWGLLLLLPTLLVIIPPGAGIVRSVWMRFTQVVNERWSWHLSTLDIFCLVLGGNLLWQPRVLTTLGGQLTYLLTFFSWWCSPWRGGGAALPPWRQSACPRWSWPYTGCTC
ncbi:ComEC/Rec2 family competence protein [Lacticaseibacillus thailandensis]|uniref:ComEC/Rec2 family competence protein n=1 Tax=Lacticaseibacillus thailandensis TaxID=381741 RepID=UPI0006D008B1|nr:ComEC/Rec2 family competence protein [Lacticaseibacillus thailandensis]